MIRVVNISKDILSTINISVMHKSGIKGIIPGLLLMCVLLSAGLSSCVVDGDDWWGGPPAGWDTFNDSRLTGYWGLVQYNSDPVGAGMRTISISTVTAEDIIIICRVAESIRNGLCITVRIRIPARQTTRSIYSMSIHRRSL